MVSGLSCALVPFANKRLDATTRQIFEGLDKVKAEWFQPEFAMLSSAVKQYFSQVNVSLGSSSGQASQLIPI